MSDEERYLTLAEVRELLEKEEKKRELNYEQKLALQHAQQFARIKSSKARKMVRELLKMERVSEYHACKIADILPTHPDDVRVIFARERFTLTPEEIEEILEIVAKYYTE